jgi:hypothetical protein
MEGKQQKVSNGNQDWQLAAGSGQQINAGGLVGECMNLESAGED